MLSWNKLAAIAAVVTGTAAAQPALTTIQDILYRADGNRFTGTVYITYQSFQAGDTSNIATANLVVPVVNGALRIGLVPTTTASAGAQYEVVYNNAGINEFSEIWAVPPSSIPLRVRDVRVGSGTVVGPPPVISPIQISDVVGLQNELEIRPMRGVGFGLGRTAVINTSGQLDGAAGSLSDCVHVDGTSGPCGSGGGSGVSGAFADGETPAGTVDGVNTAFTLGNDPDPAASLALYRNGLLMEQGVDYTLSGDTITFVMASTPQSGDSLLAAYRYADPSNPLGTLTASQVVCSGVGGSTSSTVLAQLATCTVPAGVLGSGDRLEVEYQFEHTGAASGFTGEVEIGATTIATRAGTSTDVLLVGNSRFGIYSGAQTWDTESWGSTLPSSNTAGMAAEDTSQAVTVRFQGNLDTASADTIVLRNFTVIRHPAQSNP